VSAKPKKAKLATASARMFDALHQARKIGLGTASKLKKLNLQLENARKYVQVYSRHYFIDMLSSTDLSFFTASFSPVQIFFYLDTDLRNFLNKRITLLPRPWEYFASSTALSMSSSVTTKPGAPPTSASVSLPERAAGKSGLTALPLLSKYRPKASEPADRKIPASSAPVNPLVRRATDKAI
jgi:hypothetical protein